MSRMRADESERMDCKEEAGRATKAAGASVGDDEDDEDAEDDEMVVGSDCESVMGGGIDVGRESWATSDIIVGWGMGRVGLLREMSEVAWRA